VYDARVLGALPRPLSACLDALLPTLRVPSFSGRVRVRYPIHTERELVPEAVELSGAELGQLELALRTELRVWRRRTP